MSSLPLYDVVPLILKLHVLSGKDLTNVDESTAFILRYLENLEMFDPSFDNLGIVEAGRTLILKHMDIGSGSIVDKEVVIGDFVKLKGLDSVRTALLSMIHELTEGVELNDLKYIDNKKRKRNDLFESFNFDDYPPYEPVDLHIENLRESRDVATSLNFLIAVDINDFRGHYLWPDLLKSIKKCLTEATEVENAQLVLTIWFRFLQGFREERQSIDLVNCILEYLTSQWLSSATTVTGVNDTFVKLQFALLEQCLKIPLQIMMEITHNESSAILSSIFRLLASGVVTVPNATSVLLRVALVQSGGLRFCLLFFGFLRKFKVNTVAQHFVSSSLSSVLSQDLLTSHASSSSGGSALFQYFARHVIQSVCSAALKPTDSTAAGIDLSFVTAQNRHQVIDTLYAYVNNEFLSMARFGNADVTSCVVVVWSVVKQSINITDDVCSDLLCYFLTCFDHLSSIDAASIVLAILEGATTVTNDVLLLIGNWEAAGQSEVMRTALLELAKMWSKLVTRWPEGCTSLRLLDSLEAVFGKLQSISLCGEVSAVHFMCAWGSLSVKRKTAVLEELLSFSVSYFNICDAVTATEDGLEEQDSLYDVMDSVIPSVVLLVHESASEMSAGGCVSSFHELMSIAVTRLSQEQEYYEKSDLQLLDLLSGLVFAGHWDLLVHSYCQARPQLRSALSALTTDDRRVAAHIVGGVCLNTPEIVECTDDFIVKLLCQATRDVQFRADCLHAIVVLSRNSGSTLSVHDVSEILTAFVLAKSTSKYESTHASRSECGRLRDLLLPLRGAEGLESGAVDTMQQLVEGLMNSFIGGPTPSVGNASSVLQIVGESVGGRKLNLETVCRLHFVSVCSPSEVSKDQLEQQLTVHYLDQAVVTVCKSLKETDGGYYWNIFHEISAVPLHLVVRDIFKKWFVGYLPLRGICCLCSATVKSCGLTLPCSVASAVVMHIVDTYSDIVLRNGDRDPSRSKFSGMLQELNVSL